MAITLDGSSGITAPTYGGTIASEYHVPVTTFKNRIINGAMMIDQRNNGASVSNTTSATFPVDRFYISGTQASKMTGQQNAGAVTPPVGFTKYLGITSSSAYSVAAGDFFALAHIIEGLNFADLAWGTANAQPISISFWARSSLTGTFGGAIENNSATQCYVFSYTISNANTWEYKTITIPGSTTGTWLTDNNAGVTIRWGLGVGSTYSGTAGSWGATRYFSVTGAQSVVGTSGATFYITGVQLEKGSTATSFDYRPYGTELQLCQRYYYRNKPGAANLYLATGGYCYGTTTFGIGVTFPVVMRVAPTALEQTGTAADYKVLNATGTGINLSAVPTFDPGSTNANGFLTGTVASGLVAGNTTYLAVGTSGTAYLGWSAEL